MSHRLAIGCIRDVNAVPLVCSARMAWRRSGYEAAEVKPASMRNAVRRRCQQALAPPGRVDRLHITPLVAELD